MLSQTESLRILKSSFLLTEGEMEKQTKKAMAKHFLPQEYRPLSWGPPLILYTVLWELQFYFSSLEILEDLLLWLESNSVSSYTLLHFIKLFLLCIYRSVLMSPNSICEPWGFGFLNTLPLTTWSSQNFSKPLSINVGFPGGSDGKESACSAGDPGLIPESGRSPGEGNGNPLQYSCLENPMDREAWWVYSPWGHQVSDTTEWLTLSLFQIT